MKSITSAFTPNATNMIRLDHTHTMATFQQYRISSKPQVKRGLVNTVCLSLEVHSQLEEEIFYPAVREVSDSEAITKALPEHAEMKRLIAVLRDMEPDDARYDDTFMALMRDVFPMDYDSRGQTPREAGGGGIRMLVDAGLLAPSDRVIFTSGEHMETRGATNTLRLLQVGENGEAEGLGEL